MKTICKSLLVCVLLLSSHVSFATSEMEPTAVPKETAVMHKLVFMANPSLGFIDPKVSNDGTTFTNNSLTAAGFTGMDLSQVKNSLGSELYLGYQFMDNMDTGLAFSFPIIKSLSAAGTDPLGGASSRVEAASAYVLSARMHYYWKMSQAMKLYVAPSVGVGFHSATADFTSTVPSGAGSSFSIAAKSTTIAAKAAAGGLYQISRAIGIYAEGGYLYNDSGTMTVTSVTNVPGQAIGGTFKASTGDDYRMNQSGMYVSLGLAVNYSM